MAFGHGVTAGFLKFWLGLDDKFGSRSCWPLGLRPCERAALQSKTWCDPALPRMRNCAALEHAC